MSLNFFAKLYLSIVVGKKWQRDLFRQMLTDFIDTEHELVLPPINWTQVVYRKMSNKYYCERSSSAAFIRLITVSLVFKRIIIEVIKS